MKKTIIAIAFAWILVIGAGLLSDLCQIQNEIIRLHVVGASDSNRDQTVKLQVRDAVNEYLSGLLGEVDSKEEAWDLILHHLQQVENISNQVLQEQGFTDRVSVTLKDEAFPRRYYDTFSLPAGVYSSLRIRIGEAEGQNWWCVVFPSLCLGENETDFRDSAAGAGFSDTLTDTLSGESEYEIRFFFLDLLGQLQNLFHRS